MRKNLTILLVISAIATASGPAVIHYLPVPVRHTLKETSVKAKVVATMYNAIESQCDSDPYVTAGLYEINPDSASEYKWVALSRNLLKRWGGDFWYGDTIKVLGTGNKDGIYTVVDCMNKRFTNRMDILETLGVDWYKYNSVTIIKLENNNEI